MLPEFHFQSVGILGFFNLCLEALRTQEELLWTQILGASSLYQEVVIISSKVTPFHWLFTPLL